MRRPCVFRRCSWLLALHPDVDGGSGGVAQKAQTEACQSAHRRNSAGRAVSEGVAGYPERRHRRRNIRLVLFVAAAQRAPEKGPHQRQSTSSRLSPATHPPSPAVASGTSLGEVLALVLPRRPAYPQTPSRPAGRSLVRKTDQTMAVRAGPVQSSGAGDRRRVEMGRRQLGVCVVVCGVRRLGVGIVQTAQGQRRGIDFLTRAHWIVSLSVLLTVSPRLRQHRAPT